MRRTTSEGGTGRTEYEDPLAKHRAAPGAFMLSLPLSVTSKLPGRLLSLSLFSQMRKQSPKRDLLWSQRWKRGRAGAPTQGSPLQLPPSLYQVSGSQGVAPESAVPALLGARQKCACSGSHSRLAESESGVVKSEDHCTTLHSSVNPGKRGSHAQSLE